MSATLDRGMLIRAGFVQEKWNLSTAAQSVARFAPCLGIAPRPLHRFVPSYNAWTVKRATTVLRPALSAFLATLLLSYSAAQQLDAKNWGKNSPGITLALREGPRQKTAQGTLLLYNVLGHGFPSGAPYELWQWKAGQEPKRLMQGVSFDKRGVLVCSGAPGFCKGDGPDDPVNIQATAQPGESKRLAVISSDGKVAGFAEALPFPLQH